METNFIYRNRYNDSIVFTRTSENTFLMSGGQYMRYGWDSEEDRLNNNYNFVDPSGGPYVSIGMTMGYIDNNLRSKVVYKLGFAEPNNNNNNTILIETFPERIISATVNNVDEYRIYSADGIVIETLSNFNDAVKWLEDKYECG